MRWPAFKHVFFDCDSTLTAVEGIDALAESVGKKWRVEVLTQAAMDGNLDLEDVYAKRLRAVKPTRKQVRDIRRVYKQHTVPDAKATIAALQTLGHQVYIISGGLAEPVAEFGVYLGVQRDHIRAVDVHYDQLSGAWWENWREREEERYLQYEEGELTVSDGKARIVKELLGEQDGRSLLIGDGHSDLLAGEDVNLFVGYGGVVTRPHVQARAPAFLHSASLAPLPALAAGPAALHYLQSNSPSPFQTLAIKALHLVKTGAITFQDEQLNRKFQEALHASRQTIHPRTH